MAFLSFSALSMGLSFSILLLISPASSLNCEFQPFPKNVHFSNCTDLPKLSAYLHWTYDAQNSSLSIAFIAPPARPSGWIAWAINPTGTGMVGAQALIASQVDGAMSVKTYDIKGYHSVAESKLSFDVWDLRAEITDGIMKIFATVKVPENVESVNQVWQVGPAVGSEGAPVSHEFRPGNLNSKGVLELGGGSSGRVAAGAPVGAQVKGESPAPAEARNLTNGISRIGQSKMGLFVFSVLVIGCSFIF